MTTAPDPETPHSVSRAFAGSVRKPLGSRPRTARKFPQLTDHAHADVTVVGGGVVGLWCALEARKRYPDASIAVIDANRIASASSSRSAGVVYASLTTGLKNARARWPEDAEVLERLGDENLRGMRDDLEAMGIDVGWRESGSLTVALSADDATMLRRAAVSDRGVYFDAQSTRERVNSQEFRGSYFDPTAAAVIDSQALVAGLIDACLERKIDFYENTKAIELEILANAVGIETQHAGLHTDKMVLATGAFRSVLVRHRLATAPAYDYAFATEPLTDKQLDSIGWRDGSVLRDVANPFGYAYVTDDQRIVWGGSQTTYIPPGSIRAANENRTQAYEALATDFFTVFPQLHDVRIAHHWSGVVNVSSSFAGQVGLVQNNIVWTTGYSGQALAAARFFAQTSFDLLDGVSTERTGLGLVQRAPVPFPPEPFTQAAFRAAVRSLVRGEHRGGRRNALMQTLDALSGVGRGA